MQTMNQFPGAGAEFAAQKTAAGAGMRSLQDDLWRRVFEMRQRQANKGFSQDARNRKLGMISAGLGAAGSLPFGAMFGGGRAPGGGGGNFAAPYVDPYTNPMIL